MLLSMELYRRKSNKRYLLEGRDMLVFIELFTACSAINREKVLNTDFSLAMNLSKSFPSP